jgi:predicted esterase
VKIRVPPLLWCLRAVSLLWVGSFALTAHAADQNLQTGVILPKVVTQEIAGQSYALYLPTEYTPAKRWPIVYAFDPAARGVMPVELMKNAAEQYGYIIAGSNNSRNGSVKIESDAAQAILQDTHARLSIDDGRVYFAGFSGGARLAAVIAQRCKCAAGVILAGAGFQPGSQMTRDSFAVFSAVGSYDFNYGEVIELDSALQVLNAPHFLRRFDGPHQWPPAAFFDEALPWFRLQAMKTRREPRNASFIGAQLALETKRVQSFESTDPFATWFEARQAAEAFDGLADISTFRAQQKSLETQKSIVDAAKREKQEIKDQEDLSADIFKGFTSLTNSASTNGEPPVNVRNDVRQQILILKNRADHEKRSEKARALKRALAGVFVSAMETGLARIDANDPGHARDYFELAIAADPDSVWALINLAVALAGAGDRKGALETLRRAKEKWTDNAAFIAWLNSEPAFTKLRDTPEFRSLSHQ